MNSATVQVTLLVDNRVPQGSSLSAEHGFCALVETEHGSVLLDTGKSGLWAENARKLGVPLDACRKLVLSHGHYDHTGGLVTENALAPGTEIIAHPDAFADKYACPPEGKPEPIGMPFSAAELTERGFRMTVERDPVEVLPGVWTTSEVPRLHGEASTEPRLCVKQDGELVPDPLLDDCSLVFDTPRGWVVLTGCAHSGLTNVLHRAAEVAGTDRFHAVVGGTHLVQQDGPQLSEALSCMLHFGVEAVAPCHCTSPGAARRIAMDFPDTFVDVGVGSQLVFAD